jgi:predicted GH43/DUF377 family glycosyl hydrolase
LSPERDYERFGKVPNVVFSCGSVVIDEELYLYYGAADNVICVAKTPLEKLLASMRK